jgi:hypothetical protein
MHEPYSVKRTSRHMPRQNDPTYNSQTPDVPSQLRLHAVRISELATADDGVPSVKKIAGEARSRPQMFDQADLAASCCKPRRLF